MSKNNSKSDDQIHLVDWENYNSPYYTDSHKRWRAHVRKFVDNEILPNIDKWEKNGDVPKEFYVKAYEAGIYSFLYPKEYNGTPFEDKYDIFYKMIFYEEVARAGSGGIFTSVWIHFICIPVVLHFGTPEQKRIFKDIVNPKKLAALAISEPYAGSDVGNIRTTAKKDGDYYIVDGEKYWISGGTKADWFVTAVRTGGPGKDGISLILIERGPGVITSRLPLQGHDCSNTAYVVFKNCRVPAKNLIGQENKGFKLIMFNFNQERFGLAAQAIGFCRVLIDEAAKYAKSRETFGKKLIEHQVIRHKLAEMARLTLASHALMEKVAYQMKIDPLGEKDFSLARNIALFKVQSTKTMEYCAREASQIFGGRSYIKGGRAAKIDRIYRDVRAHAIYGGSEEIMLDLAVRQAKL